jgi:hypothetical protein
MIQDENYLTKLMLDTIFLSRSPLADYFNFSDRSDPFLVFPAQELFETSTENGQVPQPRQVLFISKPLMQRIRINETLLFNDQSEIFKPKTGTSVMSPPKPKPTPKRIIAAVSNQGENTPQLSAVHSYNVTDSQKNSLKPQASIESRERVISPRSSGVTIRPIVTKSQAEKSKNGLKASVDEKKSSAQPSPKPSPKNSMKKETSPLHKGEQAAFAPTEKESGDLVVEPLHLDEEAFAKEVKDHLSLVDDEVKRAILSDANLLHAQIAAHGMNLTPIRILDSNKRNAGLAIVYVDKEYFGHRRLIIAHYSTYKQSQFVPGLNKLTEFIWENDECTEIMFSLYHSQVTFQSLP